MDCRSKPLLQLEHYPAGVAVALSTDQEYVHYLRLGQQERESVNAALGIHTSSSEAINEKLASGDPSTLEPSVVAAGPPLGAPKKTPLGRWFEKTRDMVFASGAVDSRRKYIGVKTEHVFVPNSMKGKQVSKHANKKMKGMSNKTTDHWILVQYHNLRQEGLRLVIEEEEMTVCKVYFVPTPNSSTTTIPRGGVIRPDFGEAATPHLGFPSHVMTAPAMIDQPVPGVVNPLTSTPLDVVPVLEEFENWLNSPSWEEQLTPSEEERVMEHFKDLENAWNGSNHPAPVAGGSDVWKYHDEILGENHKRMYAACRKCHCVIRAESKKHGTHALLNHPCTRNAINGEPSSSSAAPQPPKLP